MRGQRELVVEHPVMVVTVRLSTVIVMTTVCVIIPASRVILVVGIADVTVAVLKSIRQHTAY